MRRRNPLHGHRAPPGALFVLYALPDTGSGMGEMMRYLVQVARLRLCRPPGIACARRATSVPSASLRQSILNSDVYTADAGVADRVDSPHGGRVLAL